MKKIWFTILFTIGITLAGNVFASGYIVPTATNVYHLDNNLSDSAGSNPMGCYGSTCPPFASSTYISPLYPQLLNTLYLSAPTTYVHSLSGTQNTGNSLSFWVYSPVLSNQWEYLTDASGGSGSLIYRANGCAGNEGIAIYNGAQNYNICTTLFTAANWHNIIINYVSGANTLLIYIDGTFVTSETGASGIGQYDTIGSTNSAYNADTSYISDVVFNSSVFSSGDILAISSGDVVCSSSSDSYCSGGGGPAMVAGSFDFPISSSALIPDFRNWAISLSAATGSQLYGVIEYQQGTSWSPYVKTYVDPFEYNLGTDSHADIPVQKSQVLWGTTDQADAVSTTFPWVAELSLGTSTDESSWSVYDTAAFNIGVTTSTIVFNTSTPSVIDNCFLYNPFQLVCSSGFVSVTSSVSNAFGNAAACVPPSNVLDVGGGISYGGCYLYNLVITNSQALASSTVTAANHFLANVFPFSIPIQMLTTIQTLASSTLNSSTPAQITVVGPAYMTQFSTSTRTIVILSSSTIVPYVGAQFMDLQQKVLNFAILAIMITSVI